MIIEEKKVSDPGNHIYPHLVVLSSKHAVNQGLNENKFQFGDIKTDKVSGDQHLYTLICLADDDVCNPADVAKCLNALEIPRDEDVAVMLYKDSPCLEEIRKGLQSSQVRVTVYYDAPQNK